MLQKIGKILFSPASIGAPDGFKMEGPAILIVPASLGIVFLVIASLVWAYKDAKKRGKSGLITLLFLLLTGFPASFIWWFWLRPPLKSES